MSHLFLSKLANGDTQIRLFGWAKENQVRIYLIGKLEVWACAKKGTLRRNIERGNEENLQITQVHFSAFTVAWYQKMGSVLCSLFVTSTTTLFL